MKILNMILWEMLDCSSSMHIFCLHLGRKVCHMSCDLPSFPPRWVVRFWLWLVQLVLFSMFVWNELCSAPQPAPPAAAVTGVTYSIRNTQSSHRCPCKKGQHDTKSNKFTTHVSYSAVNISVIARNAAGYSPAEIIQVLPVSAADLKSMCVCVRSLVCHISCVFIL